MREMVRSPAKTDRRGEAGFTLIELMAALTLLAIGIVGVIGVMNSSFQVVGTASARSKATAVATRWIEFLRSKPYNEVLAEARLTNGTVTEKIDVVGGLRFRVRYSVDEESETTAPTSGAPTTDAYVKAVVWVNWTDTAGPHDVYQTTLIYPGGRGLHTIAPILQSGSGNTRPLKPSSLTAAPVTASSSVDLTWVPPSVTVDVPPPASWVVQYSRSSSFLPGEVQEIPGPVPSSVTTMRISDLAEGTTYHFRVFSRAANGLLSLEAASVLNVVTNTSGVASCAVGTTSATPSALKKRGGAESTKLVANPIVEVQLVAACSTSTFEIVYSPQAGLTRTVPLVAVADRPGTLTATVNGNEPVWTVGDRPIDVYSYTSGVRQLRANLRLIVCDHNKAVCP